MRLIRVHPRQRSISFLIGCLSCLFVFSRPDASAETVLTIYPEIADGIHHASLDLDRYHALFYEGLCAYDLAADKQAWALPLPSTPGNQRPNCAFGGRRAALFYETEGLIVLDAVSGKELWRHLDSSDGYIIGAVFSDVNERLGLLQERAWRVYSGDGKLLCHEMVHPPFSQVHAVPGSESFVLERRTTEKRAPTEAEVYLWRPDFSALVKLFDLNSPSNVSIAAALSDDAFLLRKDGGSDWLHNVVNAAGAEQTSWSMPGHYLGCDSRSRLLAFSDSSGDKTTVAHWSSGEIRGVLHQEGHRFLRTCAAGSNGLLSLDLHNNLYYWPIDAEAEPRLLLQGRHFLPGSLRVAAPPYLDCIAWKEEGATLTRCLLDGFAPMYSKTLPGRDSWIIGPYCSSDPLRMAVTQVKEKNHESWNCSGELSVYEAGKESPLLSMPGRIAGISPDGRFIVVQTTLQESSLVDVASGTSLGVYSGSDCDAAPCFSNDNRRAAVCHYPHTSIIELTPPYRTITIPYDGGGGRPYCFSPDGALLLSGGPGCVWLHDSTTGKQVQRFVETARFNDRYQNRREGFWNAAAGMASDFAGKFTDRFKRKPWPRAAFSRQGAEIVTIAGENLIRVWDARSGKELRSIECNLSEARDAQGMMNNLVALSPNGDYALGLNATGIGECAVWSMRTGRVVRRWPQFGTRSYLHAIADDGRTAYLGMTQFLAAYHFGNDKNAEGR